MASMLMKQPLKSGKWSKAGISLLFFIHFLLAEHHVVLTHPGTDHVNGAFSISLIKGTPDAFTINRTPPLREFTGGVHPGNKALLQCRWFKTT